MFCHIKFINSSSNPVIAHLVLDALKTLLDRDSFLLSADANERTISAQLSCYLKPMFPDWDVDVEYNRQGQDPKKIWNGDREEFVYPDIIIHRRGTQENLLAIEMKKGDSDEVDGEDKRKLCAYIFEHGYEHAVFIRLSTTTLDISAYEWITA